MVELYHVSFIYMKTAHGFPILLWMNFYCLTKIAECESL